MLPWAGFRGLPRLEGSWLRKFRCGRSRSPCIASPPLLAVPVPLRAAALRTRLSKYEPDDVKVVDEADETPLVPKLG